MIYHIAVKNLWTMAKAVGRYEPESLTIDGYVHCTTEELFSAVANFYFKGRTGLVLLEIDEEKLTSDVRWEEMGSHRFPHVYGAIPVEAVVREADLVPNDKGELEFPFKIILH